MLKKILIGLGLIIAVLVVIEVVALLVMKSSVVRYASYWKARAAEPGEFIYVALGDSTAQGIGATSPARGYVGLIASRIEKETGKKVKVINLSATGAKISDVVDRQLPAMKKLAEHQAGTIGLVTMEIGANNLQTYDEATFRTEYERVLAQLPAGKSVVSDMPYFGGRIDVHGKDIAASKVITSLTNQYGIPVAPLYRSLSDHHSLRIYAADYFHPSNHGYGIWLEAFWPEIQARIKQ